MNWTVIGLFAGLLVAVAAAAGGSIGFLLALVLGALGFAAGRYADGAAVSLDELLRGRRRG